MIHDKVPTLYFSDCSCTFYTPAVRKKSIRIIPGYRTELAIFPNNTVNNGKISMLPLNNKF